MNLILTAMLLATGTVVELDGLRSEAPPAWKREPVSGGMRLEQFLLPRAAGDERDAELVIFYFGEGGGGTAEANVARWKSMFEPPKGKSIDEASTVSTTKVGAVQLTTLDVRGTYLFKARPMDAALTAERRPGHRMIGVVFASPKGPYYLRLVGPEKTVAQHEPAFSRWLQSFR